MKYFSIFAFLLIAFFAISAAQCPGSPRRIYCRGRLNRGRSGRRCRPRNMWYYNTNNGRCTRFRYLGCSGNNNRHCSKADCERLCRR